MEEEVSDRHLVGSFILFSYLNNARQPRLGRQLSG